MEITIPFEKKNIRGNYFGHKVCYKCNQVYDARFNCCINCGSDVWGNLRTYENRDGKIYVNEIKQDVFNKILYMKYGDVNLRGATWTSRFEEKIKKYKFRKNDAIILHILIPESNIVSLMNIEPITQKGIRQVIKEAKEYTPEKDVKQVEEEQ